MTVLTFRDVSKFTSVNPAIVIWRKPGRQKWSSRSTLNKYMQWNEINKQSYPSLFTMTFGFIPISIKRLPCMSWPALWKVNTSLRSEFIFHNSGHSEFISNLKWPSTEKVSLGSATCHGQSEWKVTTIMIIATHHSHTGHESTNRMSLKSNSSTSSPAHALFLVIWSSKEVGPLILIFLDQSGFWHMFHNTGRVLIQVVSWGNGLRQTFNAGQSRHVHVRGKSYLNLVPIYTSWNWGWKSLDSLVPGAFYLRISWKRGWWYRFSGRLR